MAAELLETSKLYAHTVAKVEVEWILAAAQHLVKRQHIEPYYHAASGQVMAFEKISLYGLVLVEKKPVSYSRINPEQSRELFIRAALVEGRYADHKQSKQRLKQHTAANHFFLWRQQVLAELHELEAKSRRRDIIADDQVLFDFYDQRIPPEVINFQGFEHWRSQAEQQNPQLLFVDKVHLMQRDDAAITEAQFPDYLTFEGIRVPVIYHFDPAHEDDGVTIQVPVSALHLLSPASLEWLVPGLLAEKITAMIKALPKQWRKQFAPVPATVAQLLPRLSREQSLTATLAEQLYRVKGVQVPEDCWQSLQLENYYRMNIQVLDEQGKLLDRSRDLTVLRERYRDRVQQQLQTGSNSFEQTGLTDWSFGELAATYQLQQQQLQIQVYPGLRDRGSSVDLTLFDHQQEATSHSLRGMVRLALLSQGHTVKYLHKQLLKGRELGLAVVAMGDRQQVLDDILCATVRQTCFGETQTTDTLIRTPAAFAAALEQGRSQWVERAEAIAQMLSRSLEMVVAIKQQAKKSKNPLLLATAMADIDQQLAHLFYPGCCYQTPWPWLQQYPRYLQAILLRLEKVPMNVHKDRQGIAEIEPLWQRYQEKQHVQGVDLNQPLQEYRWMLEELRVSLFAQTLGTQMSVSVKRLNKQWQLC